MAAIKENVIFILDVRKSADSDFKLKSVKCCADFIKQKICSGKKDFISFVLVGTIETSNELSENKFPNDFLNIYQFDNEMHLPSWQLLTNFYKFVNTPAADEGQWLDGLFVALQMLEDCSKVTKTRKHRLVLFYDFNDQYNCYTSFKKFAEDILNHEINLIVVSQNIRYIDNAITNKPQATFLPGTKSDRQVNNEKYALRLVSYCNARLCNIDESLSVILHVRNSRPWCWNSYFRIGTQICISISGIIISKNESAMKLKKVWHEADEELSREWQYYIGNNEVCPDEQNLMDGYMLGGTAIPYDEFMDDEKLQFPVGLTFMGFIPRKLVFEEYFCGESTYLIVHRRGMAGSAQRLDALCRVLLKVNRAILCWKVFSEKYNKPRIVVLIPNESNPDCPSSFNMLELAHHDQYHFFQFPKLKTKHTECTDKQLKAIDQLIDAMDLSSDAKCIPKLRRTGQKELLSFDHLEHIFEQNFMDILERKILCKALEHDEEFEEILRDKNFVEQFWKLPEQIEQAAKDAAKHVKELFPITKPATAIKKAKADKPKIAAETAPTDMKDSSPLESLGFDHIRIATAVEDYKALIQHTLLIKDQTQRDIKFNEYSAQFSVIIWNEIFQSKGDLNFLKLSKAFQAYRKGCSLYNASENYNKWICDVKTELLEKHPDLRNFWENVIVKKQLGLCFIGDMSLEEQTRSNEFYKLQGEDVAK